MSQNFDDYKSSLKIYKILKKTFIVIMILNFIFGCIVFGMLQYKYFAIIPLLFLIYINWNFFSKLKKELEIDLFV